ncbi:MAG: hypothetical protein WA322_19870 [Pseudolabrys sp.]
MIRFERRFNPGDTVRVVESVFFDCLNLYEGMDDREVLQSYSTCLGAMADPKKAGERSGWAPQYYDLAAIITDAWRCHNKRFRSKGL